MNDVAIEAKKVSKTFPVGRQAVPVLKDISFEVKKKQFVVIFGPSGCGKSTLLHIMLGLENPTQGEVIFFGRNIYQDLDEDGRADFRKKSIGMVYQQPNWIKALTVLGNVAFPLTLNGMAKPAALAKARRVLETVGMTEWASYVPTELSSGQQQKVALARSIVTDPEVIIADEPTGNLDFESGQELMKLLKELHSQGKTVIMVTHDLEYLSFAKQALQMFDGRIIKQYAHAKNINVNELKKHRVTRHES